MEVIKRRVAHLAHNKDVVGDFMFLDEAQANLDQADKKEARDVRRKLSENAEQHQEWLAEFKERKARPSTGKKGKTASSTSTMAPNRFQGLSTWRHSCSEFINNSCLLTAAFE